MTKEDLYGGEDEAPQTEPRPGEEDTAPEAQNEDQDQPQTFLVNKDVLADAKPGDRFTIEVLKDHGEEFEARVISSDDDDHKDQDASDDSPTAPVMREDGSQSANASAPLYD